MRTGWIATGVAVIVLGAGVRVAAAPMDQEKPRPTTGGAGTPAVAPGPNAPQPQPPSSRLTEEQLQAELTLLREARDLTANGRDDEAVPIYRLLVSRYSERYGVDHILPLETRKLLISSLLIAGQVDEALTLQEDLLQTLERLNGMQAEAVLEARLKLAVIYARTDEPARAVPLLEELLRLQGADPDQTVQNLVFLGQTLNSVGRPEAAAARLNEALDLLPQTGLGAEMEGSIRAQLADSLNLMHRPAEAAQMMRQAFGAQQGEGRSGGSLVYWHWSLADFEQASGQPEAALGNLREAKTMAVSRLLLRDPGEGSGERARFSDLFQQFVDRAWDAAHE